MNVFLHGMDSARIEWCDTINNPQSVQDRNLLKYNIVVANPRSALINGALRLRKMISSSASDAGYHQRAGAITRS